MKKHTLVQPPDVAWSTDRIVLARTQLSRGDVKSGALLAQSMVTDNDYSTALNKRIDNLILRDLKLVPTNEDEFQKHVAERATDLIREVKKVMPHMMFWWHSLRISVAIINWTVTSKGYLPCIDVLHPYYLRYDSREDCWYYAFQGGEEKVTPGDGRWIMFGGSLHDLMTSAVRSLADLFGQKLMARYYQAYWLENRSLNWVHIDSLSSETEEDVQSLVNDMIGSTGPMRILTTPRPKDGENYKITPLNLGGEGWQGYDTLLSKIADKYITWFLGANLGTSIVNVGSFAASKEHGTMEDDKALKDNQTFKTYMTEQLVLPYTRLNIDAYAKLDDVPELTYDFEETEDVTLKITAANSVFDLLAKIEAAGKTPGAELVELAESLGIISEPIVTVTASSKEEEGFDQEPLTDESIEELARKMTEHDIANCEHGYKNRCRICGVERTRDFIPGDDGVPQWTIAWRPIK